MVCARELVIFLNLHDISLYGILYSYMRCIHIYELRIYLYMCLLISFGLYLVHLFR